jgi:hypothetical protein
VIFEEVTPIAVATALMAGACILVGLALPNDVADLIELTSMVVAGAVTYLTAVRLLAPAILPELIGSLTGRGTR